MEYTKLSDEHTHTHTHTHSHTHIPTKKSPGPDSCTAGF